MTPQEQTITDLCKKWKVSLTVAIEIWNAAIDAAADSAADNWCEQIVHDEIIKLKI